MQSKSHTVWPLAAPYMKSGQGQNCCLATQMDVVLQVPNYSLVSCVNYLLIMTVIGDDGEDKGAFHKMMQRTAQVSLLFGCHSCNLPTLDFILYHVAC